MAIEIKNANADAKKIANNNNMLIYVTQSLLLRLCQQPDSSSIATCYLEI